MKVLLSIIAILNIVNGDLYLQGCRGSNNRLDEPSRDRANGNRLFDSQNNDRGGYNVGKLSYYVGETVPISWTNQHSAGTYQLKGSELIIQYACDYLMRDGTTTNRIPDRPTQCSNFDCDTDVEYGRHESFTDYQYCKATTRNKGLFTANQDLNGNAAIYTRQNPQGTRRGYECPEERDYYPYWRPSKWKDIAIFTNQPDRCAAYQAESQNVKERYYCKYSDAYWTDVLQGYVSTATGDLPITEAECNSSYTFMATTNETLPKWSWTMYDSFGISEPDCITASQTRDNHHGLIGGRTYYTYEWTVPDEVDTDSETCCVVRMRYNITTNDYQGWASDSSIQAGIDFLNNSNVTNPDPDYDPAWLKIWEFYNLTYDDVEAAFLYPDDRDGTAQHDARGYVFVNNPHVDPFGWQFNYTASGTTTYFRMQLQLAINTNQFGRTFQDRTHCFQIRARPTWIDSSADIQLLTVQGKRGNIVQVYPATEYMFIPQPLTVAVGDYVHFCWTGSNTNPDNNDGQGLDGTDRSNLCPLTQPQYSKEYYSNIDGNVADYDSGTVGDLGNSYPDYIQTPEYGMPSYYNYANIRGVTPSNMAGFDINVLAALCTGRRADTYINEDYEDYGLFDFGNMKQMDDEGTTFCIDPQLVESEGQWNFICTRNNAFSNRDQKGTLQVQNTKGTSYTVGSSGLSATSAGTGSAVVIVNPGMVESGNTLNFDVTTWLSTGEQSTVVEVTGSDGGTFSSSSLTSGGWIEIWIPYTPKSLHTPDVYYRSTSTDSWSKYDSADIEYDSKTNTYYAVTNIGSGGYYKAVNVINGWLMLVAVLAFGCFGAVLGVAIYKKCNMNKK